MVQKSVKRIIRLFPRRTKATPVDGMVRIGCQPGLFDECDEVHISVSFTWDIPLAEKLERQWRHVAPTKVGGPAYNDPGGEFTPGMYLKKGYTITSRGCPNKCWFCSVWKKEGPIRELPIEDGWNILDSNILATSRCHFDAVISMLSKQNQRAEFTGGLEARLLTEYHAAALKSIKPNSMFFAYDTPSDRDPLYRAGEFMRCAGFERGKGGRPNRGMRAYVLMGYRGDTIEKARKRLTETIAFGFLPMAMLYRPEKKGNALSKEWGAFHREWSRPAIMSHLFREN